MQMKKSITKNFRKWPEFVRGRSSYLVHNATSILSKVKIGPKGFGSSIIHIGRGESTNSDAGSGIDNQVHGKYKKSKITLVDVTLSPIVNG